MIRSYGTKKEGILLYPTKSGYLSAFKPEEYDFVEKNSNPIEKNNKIEIKYYARVEKVIEGNSQLVEKLNNYYIWTKEHVHEFVKDKGFYIWILRVYKLKYTNFAEKRQGIKYLKFNKDISLEDMKPVLTDEEFDEFLSEIDILEPEDLLTVIEDKSEIKKAQKLFLESMKKIPYQVFDSKINDGTFENFWFEELKIGMISREVDYVHTRYLNEFGLVKPEEDKYYSIVCGINIPMEGINKNIGGVFAKDNNGNYYILHRFNFGGKGLKHKDFEGYMGNWKIVQDGTEKTRMVLIGRLDDEKLPAYVKNFVNDVNILKLKAESKDFDIKISFYDYLIKEGYFFDRKTIENYLLSVKVKPFVILTGNSGTGKTKLAQLFAQFVSKKQENAQTKYKIVPVGANWTENRHIVGFYNVISEQYQETPAYELINESGQPENKEIPHFLILDEMNLSHVERYFADFLSVLESGESIPLYTEKKDSVESELKIPKNLLVIGTVNVDETTYMFSPKVLDRANTIEFSTYSAKNYMNNEFDLKAPSGNIEYLENPLLDSEIRESNINDLREKLEKVSTLSGQNMWDVLSNELDTFQDILKEAGFDFGFRVINEILRFMCVAWTYEGKPETWDNWERYFDAQIKQKMLPKIHGSERAIGNVLLKLFNHSISVDNDKYPRFYESLENFKYISSAIKLQEMDKVLAEQRYVSFIN